MGEIVTWTKKYLHQPAMKIWWTLSLPWVLQLLRPLHQWLNQTSTIPKTWRAASVATTILSVPVTLIPSALHCLSRLSSAATFGKYCKLGKNLAHWLDCQLTAHLFFICRFGWKTDGSCLSNTPVDPSVGSVSGPPVASPGESGEGNVFSDSVEDEFYLVNDTCYSASNGMMDGKLYENRESCCNAISEMEQRHKCLWNQQTGGSPSSGGQPAPDDSPPRSASQLAKGSFLVFIFVRCLSLIFIS